MSPNGERAPVGVVESLTIPACQATDVWAVAAITAHAKPHISGPFVLPMIRWAMFVASGAIPIQIIGKPWAPGASVTDLALRRGVNPIFYSRGGGSKAWRELPICGSGLGCRANRATLSPS